jgi:hypothetical protein
MDGSHSPAHIFTFLTMPTSSQPGSSVGGLVSTAPNAAVEKNSATVTRANFILTLHASYNRTAKSASKAAYAMYDFSFRLFSHPGHRDIKT